MLYKLCVWDGDFVFVCWQEDICLKTMRLLLRCWQGVDVGSPAEGRSTTVCCWAQLIGRSRGHGYNPTGGHAGILAWDMKREEIIDIIILALQTTSSISLWVVFHRDSPNVRSATTISKRFFLFGAVPSNDFSWSRTYLNGVMCWTWHWIAEHYARWYILRFLPSSVALLLNLWGSQRKGMFVSWHSVSDCGWRGHQDVVFMTDLSLNSWSITASLTNFKLMDSAEVDVHGKTRISFPDGAAVCQCKGYLITIRLFSVQKSDHSMSVLQNFNLL